MKEVRRPPAISQTAFRIDARVIDRKDRHAFRVLSAEFLDDFFIQAAGGVRPVVDATKPFEDRLQNLQIVVCGCFGRVQTTRTCDEVRDEDDA